jgi:polyisoprenoid-binding protein YceI
MADKRVMIFWVILIVVVSLIYFMWFGGNSAGVEVKEVGEPGFSAVGEVTEASKENFFEFTGYAPKNVKSHVGTFNEYSSSLEFDADNNLVGFVGVAEVSSIDTGIPGLDGHLKSEEFFDAEKYPLIEFATTEIGEGEATGVLNFHGVMDEITIPVTITDDVISGEFMLDTNPFGFEHVLIREEVLISFVIVG